MPQSKEHMKRISKLPRKGKLTFEQREFIRTSDLKPVELAVMFGVSIRQVYRYKANTDEL
jgi:hypothetical protein